MAKLSAVAGRCATAWCAALRLGAFLITLMSGPALAGGEPPAHAGLFDRAFEPRLVVQEDGVTVPFHVLELGRLKLTSGRLVACDPLVFPERPAFAASLPRGEFPVRLAIARSPAWGDRTAFARLDLSASPVVRWSMAVLPGQDPAGLKPDETFGYPVDAGTGAFLDAETAQALLADKAAFQAIVDAWIGEAREGVLYPYRDTNLAVFHSGFGDGFYTTWLGHDAAGDVAAVVTDLGVVDPDKARW